jgi:hypothetical protein
MDQNKWTIERDLPPGFEGVVRNYHNESVSQAQWEVEISHIMKPSSFVVMVRGKDGATLASVWERAVGVLRAYNGNDNGG